MDALQFIASLASSLAWPAAVVCIAILFRRPLEKLLSELLELRAGPVKMSFERERSKVEEVLRQSGGSPPPPTLPNGDLAELAKTNPRAAILTAYGEIEQELRRALVAADEQVSDSETALQLTQRALQRDLITAQSANAVEGAVVLRDLAIHDPSGKIAVEHASGYVTTAAAVLYAIRQNIRSAEERQQKTA
jgi:hypothetical protein